MQELSEKNKEKLIKAIESGKITDETTLGVFQLVSDMEDTVESLKEEIQTTIQQVKESEVNLDKVLESIKGKDGKTPIKGEDYFDGESYILTEQDKKDIANKITVPIIERLTVEKREIIKEQPIVTEYRITEIKEVAVLDPDLLPQFGLRFRDGLELLKGDERIDVSAIKGIDESVSKTVDFLKDWSIQILDQRTSFLIQKVSALSDRVNAGGTGGSGTPALPFNSIQYNNAGAFGGTANFTWDNTNTLLTIGGAGTSTAIHTGPAAGSSNATLGGTGVEFIGSNNSAGGMNLTVGNKSNGTSAFVDLFLQNDLADATGTHYGVINLNSSTYSDTSFGTALAVANQMSIYGTDGPTMIGSFKASTGLVNIVVGGSATANEVARFTTAGLIVNDGYEISLVANSLGVTRAPTKEIMLSNDTAAAAGAQQISPSIHWRGQGWATTPVASQSVDWVTDILPVQGTTNPSSTLRFSSSVNGGAYNDLFSLSNLSVATLNGNSGLNTIFNLITPGTGNTGEIRFTIAGTSSTGFVFKRYGSAIGSGLNNTGELWNFESSGNSGIRIGGSGGEVARFDTINLRLGINQAIPTASLDVLNTALGTTQTTTAGIALTNTTAALTGAQQISPPIRWSGKGFGGSTSQAIDFRAYVLPVQGGTNPSGLWQLQSSVNGGAYGNPIKYDTNGFLETPIIKIWKNGGTGSSAEFYNNTSVTGLTTGLSFLTDNGAGAAGGNLSFMTGSQGFTVAPNAGVTTKFIIIYGGNNGFLELGSNFDIYGGSGVPLRLGANGSTQWNINTSGNLIAQTDNTYDIGASLATRPKDLYLAGKIKNYNAIATTGWGVPAIYGTGRSVAQTAAVANVASYTVGAADGSFLVSANVLVTTATLHSFTVTVTYTDEGNTSRTVTMQLSTVAGAFITAITNAQGAVPYEGVPLHIRAKAATAITIATTGTFTTVTYNCEGTISQIA